MKSNTSIE